MSKLAPGTTVQLRWLTAPTVTPSALQPAAPHRAAGSTRYLARRITARPAARAVGAVVCDRLDDPQPTLIDVPE
ncbi:MAG TPA: hypothetical protein VF711_12305, partial [Acidimicrobiales bacterium]